MKRYKKLIVIIISLLLVCIACAVSAKFIIRRYYEDPPIEVATIFPEEIKAGDDFTWKIVIKNTSEKKINITKIEITDEILNRAVLVSISPNYKNVQFNGGSPYLPAHSYSFENLDIDANATKEIVIKSKAIDKSYNRGWIWVSVGKYNTAKSTRIEYEIKSL